MIVIARARDIAEEIRLALGAGREQFGCFPAQAPEYLGKGLVDCRGDRGEAIAAYLRNASLLEIVELFEELLQTKRPFQACEKGIELDQACPVAVQRTAEQRELPIDPRLLPCHPRRRCIVRARVRNPAPDHLSVLVE